MKNRQKQAFQLIILLGVISLLGDIIYEGARGVSGQYLNVLKVNAARVGFIIGFGEFLGYLVRFVSGYFADKTKSYWLFTIIGYGLLVSVPLISLTGLWKIVAALIVLERIGKGIRTPARDTIASHAATQVGTGFGFGIAEFIDQIGAVIGPLIFAFVFAGMATTKNVVDTYQRGYRLLWIPYFLLLAMIWITYAKFKKPEKLERLSQESFVEKPLPKSFWIYVLFVFITTTGFVNFALIGFHLKNFAIMSDASIALLYTFAMSIDAIFALVVGKIYDRAKAVSKRANGGFIVLLGIPILASCLPFLVFSKIYGLIILGILLFGIIIGVQETILKAMVADMTPIEKRSTAYGIFHIFFGLAFFIGSSLSGILYDYSITMMMISLAAIELVGIIVFYKLMKMSSLK